ncbi:MAG: RDD family protein, partial [Propionibacteriaceae bacterium]|nr:RDD family protein [Propionibacteriaceae bacterium]
RYPQPYAGGYPEQTPPFPGGYRAPATGVPVAVTADGVPLAGWWWRVLAVIVDSFIVNAIAAIPSIGIYARLFDKLAEFFRTAMQAAQTGQPPPPSPAPTDLISASDQLILLMIGLAVALAYHLTFLRWKAATPGKLICRLRVVPVDQGRRLGPLPWNTILIRVGVWVLPGLHPLLLIFKLLDVLFPLWQPKRQALHDLAARTQVVRLG